MRQPLAVLGFAVLGMGVASLAWAQTETRPHMELVRGLRKENMSDLALQYLDKLKTGNLDIETSLVLDLEYARTWLDIAADETEESKRTALIGQAKRKLEAFVAASPKHPLARQANVELARLYSVQGKTQIRRARRFDPMEERKELEAAMKEARPLLQMAADKYKATAGSIDEQLKQLESSKSPANDRLRRELLDFQLTAQLDEAITYYYLGDTYVGDDTKDVTAQGNQYKAAAKIFERIMYSDETEKLPAPWIARAWCSQAQLKAGEAGKAEKIMNDLLAIKGNPSAAAGQRVGRYFTILNNFENSSRDFAKLEKDTESWLRDYQAYRDTAEGLGCRYYLAVARRNLALSGVKFDKMNKVTGIPAAARTRLEEAQRLFKELADSDNEYAERSSRNRSQILVTLADADGQGDAPPIEALPNFERAYLMAQIQIARFGQFRNSGGKTPPSADEIKKEEIKRYSSALRYLEHALRIVNPAKDNVRDVFAAQLFLVACYTELKMFPQAAILAEYLARENPKMPKAAVAGSVAVQAYNRCQIELKNAKAKVPMPEGDVERQKVDQFWDSKFNADISRMRRAAGYLMSQWPLENSTDEARHLLAFYSARDKKYDEAWKAYAGIRNSYPALQAARLELASVMFTLIYPADEKDPVRFRQHVADRKKHYEKEWQQTLALLEGVPVPDDEASLVDALCYLDSRAQLARMFQLEEENVKAEKTAAFLLKEVDRFTKLNDEQKNNSKQTAKNIVLSAIRSQAYGEFKAGNHPRVTELLDPRIAEIRKGFGEKSPEELTVLWQRLRRTEREVVVLALQSSIQDGKIKRASELLELLDKSGGSPEESMSMMQTLVTNVRGQLDELDAAVKKALQEKDKETADARAKEAKALKDGFTELLEKLITQGDKLPMKMKLFLAQGLGGVEAYDKAAAELIKIMAIPAPPQPVEPAANATDEMQAKYKRELEDFEGYARYKRQAEYMLARNYRSAKDYSKALAVFNKMIGPVSPKLPTPKEKQGWAFVSLQVRKDKAHLLEQIAMTTPAGADRLPRWGEAVQEWVGISRTFAPQLPPLRQSLAPLDEAKKIFLVIFSAPLGEEDSNEFSLARLAWFGHAYGQVFNEERKRAAKAAEDTAAKRDRYFDLFFEQKRCSVMAYKSLGVAAVRGDAAALQAKFAALAKEFHDLQSKAKNPDLSVDIKNRIKHLVDSVPELKREYDMLVGK